MYLYIRSDFDFCQGKCCTTKVIIIINYKNIVCLDCGGVFCVCVCVCVPGCMCPCLSMGFVGLTSKWRWWVGGSTLTRVLWWASVYSVWNNTGGHHTTLRPGVHALISRPGFSTAPFHRCFNKVAMRLYHLSLSPPPPPALLLNLCLFCLFLIFSPSLHRLLYCSVSLPLALTISKRILIEIQNAILAQRLFCYSLTIGKAIWTKN